MKIGILTLPIHTNYGGNLQAFALMTVLKRMGHEPCFINRRYNKIPWIRYPFTLAKRLLLNRIPGQRHVPLFYEKKKEKEYWIISRYTRPFTEKHIQPRTKEFRSSGELLRGIVKYNFQAVIVGSDQVWRSDYTPDMGNYFLDFIKRGSGIKRIAYAASFGTDHWQFSETETSRYSGLLKQFDAVSTREKSGSWLCEHKLGVTSTHVLDPTMLLEPADYLDLVASGSNGAMKFAGDLLVYVLDETEDKTRLISFIAKSLSLSVFRVNSKTEDITAPIEERIAPPTEEWIQGFAHAKCVITDSFHACVFAILFRKPFWVYGNKARGITRFQSLLEVFGLEDRMITSYEQLKPESVESPVDWDRVENILDRERSHSLAFLTDALKP